MKVAMTGSSGMIGTALAASALTTNVHRVHDIPRYVLLDSIM